MRELLNPEGPVLSFITRIVDTVWLNLLWLLCCIPIVTAGAATTALFSVTLKMVKNEEGNVTRQFFQAFRSNFRFSTKVWLVMLAGIAVLATDGYILWHLRYRNAFWTVLSAVYLVLVAGCGVIAMYIFPLMARFENTMLAMFRNSLLIGMRFLLCTAAMAAIYFLMLVIIVRFFTPAVIFGEGMCAFLCSYLLTGVLERCEPSSDPEE